MVKYLVISLLLVGLALCGTAQADVIADGVKWIEDHVGQTGIIYTDKSDLEEVVGATIIKDLFIEKMDLAAIYDLDKMIGFELDYILKNTDNYDIYVGVGVGLDRIERLDSDDLGEVISYLGGGAKF